MYSSAGYLPNSGHGGETILMGGFGATHYYSSSLDKLRPGPNRIFHYCFPVGNSAWI